MMEKVKRLGQHHVPGRVRVTPEFRKEPDIEKLVHALILIAEKMANEEQADRQRKEAA